MAVTATRSLPVTHLSPGAAWATLALIAGFVLAAGVVTAFGRARLEGSFKARSRSGPGQGSADQAPDRTFLRSWLAIALVGGLLIFSAVSFQLDDPALRNSLLGAVIASTGAATAFYFAARSSDQARRDMLTASVPATVAPALLGRTRSEVNAAIAGTPLSLDASPPTGPGDWIAVAQDPPPNQQIPAGSRLRVTFAGAPSPQLNEPVTNALVRS
jgi:hypothetical protein